MFNIYVRPVITKATHDEQVQKVDEEYKELKDAIESKVVDNIISEACDLIQSVISLICNHYAENFRIVWWKHMQEMRSRKWKSRD